MDEKLHQQHDWERRRDLSIAKLEEVQRQLGTETVPFPSLEKTHAEPSDFLTASSIASRLFHRAPVNFLEQKTIQDLVWITNTMLDLLEKLDKAEEKIIVESDFKTGYCALFIGLEDRPFIIRSVSSCVEDCGFSSSVHLHPILLCDGSRVSISYIEISDISPAELDVLVRRIKRSLRDVVLVNLDYTSMSVRVETLSRLILSSKYHSPFSPYDNQELSELLAWMVNNKFVFIGHAQWSVDDKGNISDEAVNTQGIFCTSSGYKNQLLQETREDIERLVDDDLPYHLTKLRTESPVYRRSRLNNLVIPEYSTGGRLIALHAIVGLLTTKALVEDVSLIPIARKKLQKIVELEGALEDSFDYKHLVEIVNTMPKDEVFILEVDELAKIVQAALRFESNNDTNVSLRFDPSKREVFVVIVMPRERFSSEVRNKIQEYLETAFNAPPGTSQYHLDLGGKPVARFYFSVPIKQGNIPKDKPDSVAL